ncbi:ABC transporter ATP-binding protein [Citricoccus sp. NR2]|uniref:ABC transporter ATP-binding protein n=1 Tax=Citricoccus sp. NR2 TaxID=3004095 RepID=UPI0022DDE0AB|nr:ABC transporter ATP-binding protein [Citricoccus sp. NR2]WBL20439.1 ABC transporter ATP-binding protein [Citricoccus sp. NR2]
MTEKTAKSPERSIWQAIARLSPYLDGVRWRWALGLTAALAASLVALVIPQVIQHLVNSIVHAGSAQVWTAALVMAVLGVAEAGLIYARRFFVLPPAAGVETRARVALYRKLQRMPLSFHDTWPSGQLLSRAVSDLNLLRRWIAFGTIMFIVSVITILVGMGLMFSLSWQLALVYLLGAVPIMWRSFGFRLDFRAASRLSQDQAGDLATTVEESVHGIRVLKAFGRSGEALDGFRSQADTLRGTEVHKATVLSRFIGLVVALPEIVLGISLALGLYLTADGSLTVGALAAFFATAMVLAGPVESVGQLMGMALSAKTAIDRHIEVMDQPAVVEPSQPQIPPRRGSLEFRGAEFHYADAEPDDAGHIPALFSVNLEVRPGETMALVGVTGSGKSTLAHLAPRLYDVTGGQVLVDGVDVREMSLDTLRTRVAIALEEPTLFSDTVRNNVLLAADEEMLHTALHTAHADFVYDLPEGVETQIGEQGLSLSGGQRQRLSLARAIAARPDILVLDDPLSAVDVHTEELITARLREVLADTTVLIVAHRRSTVALADRVAVLHEGRIVEVGAPDEMRSEIYRELL